MAEFAFGVSYSLENDAAFSAALKRASDTVQDLRIPFGLIGRDFYKSELAIFKLQGPGQYPVFKNSRRVSGPSGTAKDSFDVEKSPYQLKKIKKYGFDYPLLVASGRLAASITQPNAAGSVYQVSKLSMVIGTTVPYGIFHQSDAPRKKIPLRKFVFIGPEAPQFATSEQMGRLGRWNNYLNDYVLKAIAKESA